MPVLQAGDDGRATQATEPRSSRGRGVSESKLEAELYESMRMYAMSEQGQGFPMPEREMHPFWCCEHVKGGHVAAPVDPWCAACPAPVRQHDYHRGRDWRCDFVWPDLRLIVEVEGGVYSGGRHTRGSGYTKDTVKYNALVNAGWNLQRFTGEQVRSGEALNRICQVLSEIGARP